MSSDGYSWAEKVGKYGAEQGSWKVDEGKDGGVYVDVADCGCCGSVDVLHVQSVEEFDKEWERIGKMLRTHVRRAVKHSE